MRTMLLVLALAIGASTARADSLPNAGRFKGGRVTNSSVAIDQQAEGKKIFWTFDVKTSSTMGIEFTVPLHIPKNASVTSMRVKVGDQEELFGESVIADDARTRYELIVARAVDPALLEHVTDSELRLRVFPVSQTWPAAVTIEMFIPGETHVELGGAAVSKTHSLVATPVTRHYASNQRSMGRMFRERTPAVPDPNEGRIARR